VDRCASIEPSLSLIYPSVVIVDTGEIQSVYIIDCEVVQTVQDQIDEAQRYLALERLLGRGAIGNVGVPPFQKKQNLFHHFRPRIGGRVRVRVRFTQQESLHERQQAGERQLDESGFANALVSGEPLPGQLLPVQLFGLLQKMTECLGRDVRGWCGDETCAKQPFQSLSSRSEK
jgi:hypothetical protein